MYFTLDFSTGHCKKNPKPPPTKKHGKQQNKATKVQLALILLLTYLFHCVKTHFCFSCMVFWVKLCY